MSKLVVGLLLYVVTSVKALASTYVAIGDSITSGTHAEPDINHGFHYSWATGDKVERSFAKQAGFDAAFNVSLPGALTGILGYQASFAEHIEANYVSILAGSNDICWGLGHQVVGNLRGLIARLSVKPHVQKILVGTIPDLEQVYQIGKQRPYCQAITTFMCPNFMARGDDYRAGVLRQIKEINQEIIALQEKFPKLRVVGQLDSQIYESEDVSVVDCFHPSKVGQQKIADAFLEVLQD